MIVQNKKGLFRSKRARVLLLIFILGVVVVASLVTVFFQSNVDYVTAKSAESYAEAFVSAYNQDISSFNQIERGYFSFYSSDYTATSYISTSYGTALLLTPSAGWSFENKNVGQRIEEAIFGGNLSQTWAMFKTEPNADNMILTDFSAETNGHPFIEIRQNSSILLKNVMVNSVVYPCLILKSNNQTKHWDSKIAMNDEKQIFEIDLVDALNKSEEVREVYWQPVLQVLIQDVVYKQQHLDSYSYPQMYDDLENIKQRAKNEFGINESDTLIDHMLAFAYVHIPPPPPPPKTVFYVSVGDDIGNWWYVFGWCFLPFFAYTLVLLFRFLNNKFHWRDLKFVYGLITGGLISPFFTSLITDAPYDYHVESLQTDIVILVIVFGSLTIYGIRKYGNRLKLK